MNNTILTSTLLSAASMLGSSVAYGATITVDTTVDTFDPALCRGGPCSLRTAVYLANMTPERDDIVIPAGVYPIDNLVAGPIEVTSPIHFFGAGVGQTTISFEQPGDFGMEGTGGWDAEMLFRDVALVGGVADAGAIYADDIYYVYLYRSELRDFDYQTYVIRAKDTELLLQETSITNNVTDDPVGSVIYGDGVLGATSFLWVDDIEISGNQGPAAGSVFTAVYDYITIDLADIGGNDSDNVILDFEGEIDIDDVYFHDNVAQGSGIRIGGDSDGYWGSTTFDNNSAFDGTVALREDAALVLNNSTFVNNQATYGAAVHMGSSGVFWAVHVTAVDNAAHFGTFYGATGAINFLLSAIDGPPGTPGCDGPGAQAAFGWNVYGDATCNTGIDDLVNTDPMVGPLAYNGGYTPTMMPLPGSPLIQIYGGWSSYLQDQRGEPRDAPGPSSAGAVECQPGECGL